MSDEPQAGPTEADLHRWSEALAAIARTGLGFTKSLYEQERFEEVLSVAAEIKAASGAPWDAETIVQEWLRGVGDGVAGYVTPKVSVGAIVGNDEGKLLLICRGDSGVWLYPTGWCDVGYSPAEVVIKEVKEETGIECRPERIVAVNDMMRVGFARVPLYSLVFHCTAVGGELRPHPLETSGAGWFGPDELPEPLAGFGRWGPLAFAAIRGEPLDVQFDAPRLPLWRGDHDDVGHGPEHLPPIGG